MPYVSARYMPPGPIDPPGAPRQIQAVDDQGQVWALTEDSEVGDWLRYLEAGGTIEPMDASAPEDPVPVPGPTPSPPPPPPSSVPQAEPPVVYGQPLPE